MEAIRTFERNHPNKPQAPALVRSLPGASVGGSSLRPEGTLPSLKLLLVRSAQGKPGGARTGPRPGAEAAGAEVPKGTVKAGEKPRETACARGGPLPPPLHLGASPWEPRVWPPSLRRGGRGPSSARREGARGGRRHSPRRRSRDAPVLRRLGSRSAARRSVPAPVTAAAAREPCAAAEPHPQPVPLRTRAWRCRAPAAEGGRFKPRGLASAKAALPSAPLPRRPRSLRSGSRVTPREPRLSDGSWRNSGTLSVPPFPNSSSFNDKHQTGQNIGIRYWVGDLRGVGKWGEFSAPLLSPEPGAQVPRLLPAPPHLPGPGLPPLGGRKFLSLGHSWTLRRFSAPVAARGKRSRAVCNLF